MLYCYSHANKAHCCCLLKLERKEIGLYLSIKSRALKVEVILANFNLSGKLPLEKESSTKMLKALIYSL